MSNVEMPMRFSQKCLEVLVQLCWIPISALLNAITLSPIAAFYFSLPVLLDVSSHEDFIIAVIIAVCACLCWVPNLIIKFFIMPSLKSFEPKKGIDYNVGASEKRVPQKVQREIKSQNGTVIGYYDDVEYKVEYDNGDRHEMSGDEWAIIGYSLVILLFRVVSFISSLVAFFIKNLYVCIRCPIYYSHPSKIIQCNTRHHRYFDIVMYKEMKNEDYRAF